MSECKMYVRFHLYAWACVYVCVCVCVCSNDWEADYNMTLWVSLVHTCKIEYVIYVKDSAQRQSFSLMTSAFICYLIFYSELDKGEVPSWKATLEIRPPLMKIFTFWPLLMRSAVPWLHPLFSWEPAMLCGLAVLSNILYCLLRTWPHPKVQ